MTSAGRGLLAALAMPAALALLAATVSTAAAGCTDSEAGTPRASPSSPVGSTGPASPADPLPPRTRSVRLDGADPCTLLTEQQRAEFAMDRPPTANAGSSGPLKDAPGCSYRSSTEDYGALVITSTTIGLAEYLEQLRDNPSRKVVEAGGFPAIRQEALASDPSTGSGVCMVDVDIADGQLLAVQFGQTSAEEGKRLPIDTLCAKAVAVAQAALTTLQGQR